MPVGAASFSEAIQWGAECYHTLKTVVHGRGLSTAIGDEGGFAPDLDSPTATLQALVDAIVDAGYEPGNEVSIALDVAASEFYDEAKERYVFTKSTKEEFSSADLVELYAGWAAKYPLVSIEDGLDENDWNGWRLMTDKIGDLIQLVGDDLFVTNTKRLADGIERGAGNAILIKLNQIGTVTETLEAINLAHKNGYRSIMSHRSGETEDTSIADLAVATGCGQIKTGSVCRGERTAKYNRLLWIETALSGASFCTNPFA